MMFLVFYVRVGAGAFEPLSGILSGCAGSYFWVLLRRLKLQRAKMVERPDANVRPLVKRLGPFSLAESPAPVAVRTAVAVQAWVIFLTLFTNGVSFAI